MPGVDTPGMVASEAASPGADARAFREVLGRFATGVTVVTAYCADEEGTCGQLPHPPGQHAWGTTVNAFSSVSLDPPLVLICIGRERSIHPVIASAGRFGVNILGESSQQLSDCFAGAPSALPRSAFCDAPFHRGVAGTPVLDAAIAHLECEVEQAVDAGDHTIYIGRVVSAHADDDHQYPLLYFRGRYLQIERAATSDLRGKPDA
jgi:flavin reductase (DIM6/NTAB) family NADH-FMN oxidoreductase RutF